MKNRLNFTEKEQITLYLGWGLGGRSYNLKEFTEKLERSLSFFSHDCDEQQLVTKRGFYEYEV